MCVHVCVCICDELMLLVQAESVSSNGEELEESKRIVSEEGRRGGAGAAAGGEGERGGGREIAGDSLAVNGEEFCANDRINIWYGRGKNLRTYEAKVCMYINSLCPYVRTVHYPYGVTCRCVYECRLGVDTDLVPGTLLCMCTCTLCMGSWYTYMYHLSHCCQILEVDRNVPGHYYVHYNGWNTR